MGSGATTTQLTSENEASLIDNMHFLEKEKRLVTGERFTNHLAKIQQFGTQIQNNEKYFILQIDLQNAVKLKTYIQKKFEEQQMIDYWKIFSQMLLGIYQLHQINLLGRCLILDQIYIKDEDVILGHYGYFHPIQISPELVMNKMPTFETDLWQVAAIMFEIFSGKNIQEFLLQLKNEEQINKAQTNIENQILQIQTPNSSSLREFLLQILKVNVFERLRFIDIFNISIIQKYVPEDQLQNINTQYTFYQIQGLLKQWKYSKQRDYNSQNYKKIYFYNIKSKLIKYFYKDYLEILLLNFIFHFSLHFPCKLKQQVEINQIIIQKMWIKSKSLKVKVQISGYKILKDYSIILNIDNYEQVENQFRELKQELNFQHSILSLFKTTWVEDPMITNMQFDIDHYIQQIVFQKPNTLSSKLSLNILKNSKIRQYRNDEIFSMNIEEMFEHEIRSRI